MITVYDILVSSSSKEVVLAMNSGEVILGLTLHGRSQSLEASKSLWVVHTLFKQVELGLANTHLSVHLEHALTSIIEWVVANRFKLQVLRMASQHIERLWLRLTWMSLVHVGGRTLLLIIDNLASALVKVDIEEDHLLNVWHIEDFPEVEVYLVTLVPEVFVRVLW